MIKEAMKKNPDGSVTITWFDDHGVSQILSQILERMDMNSEYNKRALSLQMDLVMAMVPPRPWWKFWADDPHVEYEKWKASKRASA